jgi:hypothetical protein
LFRRRPTAYNAIAKAMPEFSARSDPGGRRDKRDGATSVLAVGPHGRVLPASAGEQETVRMTRLAPASSQGDDPAEMGSGSRMARGAGATAAARSREKRRWKTRRWSSTQPAAQYQTSVVIHVNGNGTGEYDCFGESPVPWTCAV